MILKLRINPKLARKFHELSQTQTPFRPFLQMKIILLQKTKIKHFLFKCYNLSADQNVGLCQSREMKEYKIHGDLSIIFIGKKTEKSNSKFLKGKEMKQTESHIVECS